MHRHDSNCEARSHDTRADLGKKDSTKREGASECDVVCSYGPLF